MIDLARAATGDTTIAGTKGPTATVASAVAAMTAAAEADAAALAVEGIFPQAHARCTKRCALNATRNAKCPSSQQKAGLSTAGTAFRSTSHNASRNA